MSLNIKSLLILVTLFLFAYIGISTDFCAPGGVRWTNQLHQKLTTSSSLEAIAGRSLYILANYKRFIKPETKWHHLEEDTYEVKDPVLLEKASSIKEHPTIEIRVLKNHAEELYISWGVMGIGILSKQGQARSHWYTREINKNVYVYFDEH